MRRRVVARRVRDIFLAAIMSVVNSKVGKTGVGVLVGVFAESSAVVPMPGAT